MIRIECQRNDGKIKSLSIKGHANSAPYGQDLVCSAVSAVTFGGLNALDNPNGFNIKVDDKSGTVEVETIKDVSTHDYQVLDTVMVQLKTIASKNEKYIKIIEKGC